MKVFSLKGMLLASCVLVCALLGAIFWIFDQYSLFKKSDIQKLVENRDEEIIGQVFGYDLEDFFTTNNLTEWNYIFEFVEKGPEYRVRLETNGKVFFNDELLYEDQDKVVEFLIRYGQTGLFNTSRESLFYRYYLKSKEVYMMDGVLPNPAFQVSLKTEYSVLFSERYCRRQLGMEFPEVGAVFDMWRELSRFSADGSELFSLARD